MCGWGVAQVLEVTRKRIKTKCIQLQRLPEICQSEINVKTSKSAQGNAQGKGYKCSKGLGINAQ